MPLIKADRSRSGSPAGGQVGYVVGDRIEHQTDRHAGKIGADAVVRSGAAESDVRVGAAQDVEGVRCLLTTQ
jgi:hypothetical protein